MSDSCYVCDGVLETVREERPFAIGSREAVVEQEFARCAECGEEFFTPEQADRTQFLAASRIREAQGLLQPGEIRSIREDVGLSQAAFEQLLGVGQKTVVRWERGTVFQSAAVNVLMELVRDVPGVAESLAKRHNVVLGIRRPTHRADTELAGRWLWHEAYSAYKVQRLDPVHLDDLFVWQPFSGVRMMHLRSGHFGGPEIDVSGRVMGALELIDTYKEVG